jgi:succinate-acetate transporter protein
MSAPVKSQVPPSNAELFADLNDPTAGRVAQAREIASAQTSMIADPAGLGLAAFALTTFLLSLVNAGILPKDTEPMVLAVALTFGGVAQLLAGMWEFKKGNVFGATVFSSYGAFWLSFWGYVTFYAPTVPAEQHGAAAGWLLICWGIFTVLMFIGSLRTTAVLAALFAVVVAAVFLLGFGALEGVTALTRAGGWVGLLAGAMAWYLCLAGVLSSVFGRQVLPNKSLVKA